MATPVTLPALGESVTEGTVTRWLKQVGDSVEVDEALLEVSTDKVDTEIPSPVAGTLLEIKVAEDETVAVGAELAIIGDPSDEGGAEQQPEPESSEPTESPNTPPESTQESQPTEELDTAAVAEAGTQPAASTGSGTAGGTAVTLPALGELSLIHI